MAEMMMDIDGWDADGFDDMFGATPDYIKLAVFMIDHSGSYEGTTIGAVNTFMEELFSDIKTGSERISIMEIDENVEWMTDRPVEVSEANFNRIKVGSYSHLGNAFSKLADKLKDSSWCPKGKKGTKGLFLLVSDGLSTDSYQDELKRLKENKLFADSIRMTLNFSDLQNPELLNSFADNSSHVFSTNGKNQLMKEIKNYFK